MRLEITPNPEHSLIRLSRLIHEYSFNLRDRKFIVNITTPVIYRNAVENLLHQNFEKIYSQIKINNPNIKPCNIYYQFDFLPSFVIDYTHCYITSLKQPRTIEDVSDWLHGKNDNLLSLIAFNQNRLTAFDYSSKRYVRFHPPANEKKLRRFQPWPDSPKVEIK